MNERDFPIALEKAGFKKINISFISLVSYAPDNADVSKELAIQQISANRISTLSSMRKALNIAPDSLSKTEVQRLTNLINQRYDDRISAYLRGEKLWDIASSSVMAVTGYKL